MSSKKFSKKKIQKILRPDMEYVHMGQMKVDESKCKKCEVCFAMENCPFRAWELGSDGIPIMKKIHECFSCSNCMVACPHKAVQMIATYHVDEGYFKTEPHPLPYKTPLEPKDAEGNPTEYTEIEKAVFNRRSVRNLRFDKPVPETLIQRVLEAGRFAPSSGNCQPWKFIVVTNKALIKEIDAAAAKYIEFLYKAYLDDQSVDGLAPMVEAISPGLFDPRIIFGGLGTVVKNNPHITGPVDEWLEKRKQEGQGEKMYPYALVSLLAPVIILIVGDERSIPTIEMNIGICGQNMNLVANSLGLGVCWNGFIARFINLTPLRRKFGIKKNWNILTALCLGYPRFKQKGVVPREYRPVTWFREGKEGPEIQE